MDMQNVAKLNIPEGEVRTIHDKDGNLIWGKVSYGVKYKGETSQQTYTGKNLVYTSGKTDGGITATYNAATGETTISGTAQRTYAVFGTNASSLPAGTYTFSIQSTAPAAVGIGTRVDGGSRVARPISVGSTKTTFTISGTMTGYDIYLTGLTVGTYYEFSFKAMLEAGNTATSFEPYVGGVPAPNPDYPQAVQTVTGENVVKITDGQGNEQSYEVNLGKNLFDKDNAPELGAYINGQSIVYYANPVSTYIKIKPNTTYTITKPILTNNRFAVGTSPTVPEAGGTLTNATQNNSAGSLTITSGGADKYLMIYFKQGNDTTPNATIFSQIQVELGSTATSYAAYFTPIELCKIGTYQDYIYKSGDKWYVHKAVGKTDLANYNYTVASTVLRRTTAIPNMKYVSANTEVGSAIAEKYIIHEGRGMSAADLAGYMAVDVTMFAVNVGTSDTSVNPTGLLYYALATPTDTEITNQALVAQLEAVEQWLTRYGYNATVTGNLPIIIDRTAL